MDMSYALTMTDEQIRAKQQELRAAALRDMTENPNNAHFLLCEVDNLGIELYHRLLANDAAARLAA